MVVDSKTFMLHTQVCEQGIWKSVCIEVKDGCISAITGRVDNTRGVNDSIDLTGCYLTPGLVDCHVHFALNAVDLQGAIDNWSDEDTMQRLVAKTFQKYLNAGVTRVRDGGDAAGIGLMARRMVEEGGFIGPQIAACGHALYKKGRYGRFLGPGIDSLEEGFRQIDGAAGYTKHLKICQSGLVSFKAYGHVGAPQFTLDELSKLTDYAHSKGLSVMAHTSGEEAIDIAVRARVDTIEHGYYVSTDTIRLMAGRGTVWVPTLSPLANLVKQSCLPYPGASLEIIKSIVDDQKHKIRLAYDEGVRIAVGTDAGAVGVEHGASIYDEIDHMASAGLPREVVFKMAHQTGRHVLGKPLTEDSGSVYGWQVGDAFEAVSYRKDPFKYAVRIEDITAVFLPGYALFP